MLKSLSGGVFDLTGEAESLTEPRSFRRRIFYVPGYDPFHPRRYRELYRKEGAEQARLSGYDLHLSPKRSGELYGWHVEAEIEGRQVAVDVEVLLWSDIVRASMSDSILATYWQLLRTAWIYIASGTIFSLMRLRKGPMIAAFYPVVFLLAQLAIALLLGWACLAVIAQVTHWLFGLPVMLLVALLVLRWFKSKDAKIYAWYLMHDFAYSSRLRGAYPAALEERMVAFRQRIRDALAEDVDEVLVIGHSSGAHLGTSILADLLRDGLPADRPVLSFLTLGQAVAMQSFLPKAQRLRRDLRDLSQQSEIAWVDVTAPGDGCAFALCDPVAVSGVATAGKQWPLVLSAAFTQTLSPARWKALRWRWFRLHFQYLCAFDNLSGEMGEYDYFRITAGPLTLWQRLGARPASKSRIERAAAYYRSVD